MFICFARHGQTRLEVKEKEESWNNSPLSSNGRKQVFELVEAIQSRSYGITWDVVVSEDTRGAKETLMEIENQMSIQSYFSPGLRAPLIQNDKGKKKRILHTFYDPSLLICASENESESFHIRRVKTAFSTVINQFENSNIIVISNEKTLSVISREFLHLSNVVWPSGSARIMEFENGKYLKTIRKVI